MLVVTSNWAIGDGTLLRPSMGWQANLPAAIHRASVRGGFGRDGRYRPIDGLDLVVAGDTFDWLVSAEWCGGLRPWHGGASARDARLRVAARSVRSARRLFATLSRWAGEGLAVPVADGRGRPGPGCVRVPVRVTLLAGDRDSAIAEIARQAPRMPFAVGDCWANADVSVRHGHDLDPACHRTDEQARTLSGGRSPTLAESVAVDLIARFAASLGGEAAAGPVVGLVRAIATCPIAGIPSAIGAWLRSEPNHAPPGVDPIETAWRQAVADWFVEARRCVPSCELDFDVLHCLAGWFDRSFEAGAADVVIPVAVRRLALPAGTGRLRSHREASRGDTSRSMIGHPGQVGWEDEVSPSNAGTHGSRRSGQGPVVLALRRGAAGICEEVIASGERQAPVVTIDSSSRRSDHGGTIIDAA